jgi:DNA invertase Pin-like site-specific DNA recombinase
MKVATYERVSTIEQTTENQRPALAGWVQAHPDAVLVRPYRDVESGTKTTRPGFDRMLKDACKGVFNVLVVWRLDRLGRSTEHLLRTVRELEEAGVTLISVRDGIDTKTASGKAFLGMLAVFAQFERDILVERTKAGMARARAAGVHVGRPRKVQPATTSA